MRDLIFKDFWLKLFSLVLAMLIWLTVSFAIQRESANPLKPPGKSDAPTNSISAPTAK